MKLVANTLNDRKNEIGFPLWTDTIAANQTYPLYTSFNTQTRQYIISKVDNILDTFFKKKYL